MPELPEVETIRRQAQQSLLGKKIVSTQVRQRKVFWGKEEELTGKVFREVRRVGKYLFLYFEGEEGLLVHLKMTGRLVLGDEWYETAPHTRVVVEFEDRQKLFYWDTRMFGYLRVEKNLSKVEQKISKQLGPEVWQIDERQFYHKLQNTKRKIKEVILDQSVIAGVGNIYANDGLWKAKINPTKAANSLGLAEAKRLLLALRGVMERGLALGGASDNTFRDFWGKSGEYQKEFLVYGRTKEPCKKCGNKLRRIVVGGRGTWICERCQR